MENKAISYLLQNRPLHTAMLEAIHRHRANLFYARHDGVLLQETNSGTYMLSVNGFETGKKLMDDVPQCKLVLLHQECMVQHVAQKYGLSQKLECVQASYMGTDILRATQELEIKPLDIRHKQIMMQHYDKLPENEIVEILNSGSVFGGYKDGVLIGFIGTHLEGSVGLLNVFPPHRRLGYGEALECYMVNLTLEKGWIPFAHIETNNSKSIALQKKLGLTVSKESIYWLF
ncbi:MAG: GNAT family N-acetyltransferase [Breznakibacter sp.]